MCGIAGYNGYKNAKEILIDSLKKLEYRGYDSAGIAISGKSEIEVLKSAGELKNLIKKSELDKLNSTVGIAHTRWATHGQANEVNAHPHLSNDKKFSVVHNGIIENYQLIKTELERKGITFLSQTDTEVIPQLLSYHYSGDVLDAIRKTVLTLDGAFAVCILCSDYPDMVFAAKKQSPLIIGRGNGESFVSSGLSALDDGAKLYTEMCDCEIAVLKKDEISFYDFNLNEIKKVFKICTQSSENYDNKGYEHFMLKEIFEQPEKLEKLFENYLENEKFNFKNLDCFNDCEKIYVVACGSAYHAALAGKIAIEELSRVSVEVEIASEFRYKNPILNEKTPVIVISQSGETADTIEGMRLAKKSGSPCVAIVNAIPSTIASESDFVLPTQAGLEVAVATTKGYTTQVAVMYMLSLFIAEKRKALSEKQIEFYTKELLKIPEKVSVVLKNTKIIKEKAEKYFSKDNIFFIGRNTDFSAACEGSLKLKEISYINSSAFAAGELKHGTIALVEKGTLVLAVNANSRLYKKTLSNIEEVYSRGADVLMLTKDTKKSTKYDTLEIPECSDVFLTLLEVIPLQLFSYFVANKKGLNIDMPKNLAKSVTVE